MSFWLALGEEGVSALRNYGDLEWGANDHLEVSLASTRLAANPGVWVIRCGLHRLGNGTMMALRMANAPLRPSDLSRCVGHDWAAAAPQGDFMGNVLTTVLLWNNCVVKNQFQFSAPCSPSRLVTLTS